MAGHFRSSTWDPVLIISQIILLQSFFYLGLGLCVVLVDLITSFPRSLDQLFSYHMLNFKDFKGELLIVAVLTNAFIGSVSLWWVVERSKLCWDFSLTCYLIHTIVCWVVNGQLSSSVSWWFLLLVSAIVTTVLAEYLCIRSEMKAIPLTNAKVDL